MEEALERSERDDERWCVAELLRIKGELTESERECRTFELGYGGSAPLVVAICQAFSRLEESSSAE
jgi:hypothetical protein